MGGDAFWIRLTHLSESGCVRQGEAARGDVSCDVVDNVSHMRRAVPIDVCRNGEKGEKV